MSKHFVVQARLEEGSDQRPSLGTREQILEELSHFNTMPEIEGDDMLWGPGIRIELPPSDGEVHQMLLHIVEDEIAWQPISKLARHFKWCVTDLETGRKLTQ
ncbi:MAG: hypothetical protein QGI78_03285 [Phycisphaerales bacterium]|jgi:hypothetical protein|nr:hypothetical protein [Phycisphaerales bacterium]